MLGGCSHLRMRCPQYALGYSCFDTADKSAEAQNRVALRPVIPRVGKIRGNGRKFNVCKEIWNCVQGC